MKLQGKVALVTGAGRGIGRAIAQAFVDNGASVVANDRDSIAVEKTAALCGAGCKFVPADISILENHELLVKKAVDEFGALDILVNNAGIQFYEKFLDARECNWDLTVGVNLKGPFFLAQCSARQMVQQKSGGIILNIASIHDSVALLDRSIYSITKGGVKMMTRSLAFELAEYGIRVNAISPGAISTDMNRQVLANQQRLDRVLEKIPLKRIGSPEEIAGAAVFLASPEASYVTGATLYVDGGILTH